jgi:hypothetical protein
VVEEEVAARLRGAVRVDVVWVPILDGDDLPAARHACAALAAPIGCYWDAARTLSSALGAALGLRRRDDGSPGLAWDVYLLYDRGARWSTPPPAPAFWMHQLTGALPLAPRLDGAALRRRVDELSARP